MYPGRGYYFFNSRGLGKLSVPSPSAASALQYAAMPAAAPSSDDWTINIALTTGGVTDNAAWLGVSSAVGNDLNRLDVHKPVGLAGIPATYFFHPDWDHQYGKFASEIHSQFAHFSEWTLQVQSEPYRDAALTFSGVSSVPSWFDVYAFNPVAGSWQDLRKSPVLRFTPVNQVTPLKILIGTHDVVKRR